MILMDACCLLNCRLVMGVSMFAWVERMVHVARLLIKEAILRRVVFVGSHSSAENIVSRDAV